MKPRPRFLVFVMLALAVSLAAVTGGCSSDDDDTPSGPTPPRELDSGNIANGGTYVHTFANAGTYPYHCSIHSEMRGTITVVAGGLASLTVLIVNATATGFQAQPVGGQTTVMPGGTVTWQNQSVTHTVTSD